MNNNKTNELPESVKYIDSINKLTEAINLCPTDAGLFFNRAILKVHKGDITGARSDFRKSEYIHNNFNPGFMELLPQ